MPVYGFDSPEGIVKVISATKQTLAESQLDEAHPSQRGRMSTAGHFRNDDDSSVPAYGVMKITGMLMNEPGFTIERSTEYGAQYLHILNTGQATAEDKFGVYATNWPALARYDTEDDAPEVGELWGPVEDSWLLRKYVGGFLVVGVPGSADVAREGLVWVMPCPLLSMEVILTEHLEPAEDFGETPNEAIVDAVCGAGDAWATQSTEQVIAVVNRSMGLFLPRHSVVIVERVNDEWRPKIPYNVVTGITDGASVINDDVVVSVQYDSIGGGWPGLSDTGKNITAWNQFGNIDSGSVVWCTGFAHGFGIGTAGCA